MDKSGEPDQEEDYPVYKEKVDRWLKRIDLLAREAAENVSSKLKSKLRRKKGKKPDFVGLRIGLLTNLKTN